MDALRQWILDQLARRNESARHASDKADLGFGYLSGFLNKPSQKMSPETAEKLAKYFGGVSYTYLISLQGQEGTPDLSLDQIRILAAEDERFLAILMIWPDLDEAGRDLLARLARLAALEAKQS